MCVISNVHDYYNPLFPPIVPSDVTAPADWSKWFSGIDASEMRKLIDEFKEAIEAAKKLDTFMKQPDCIDPDKAKLQERVDRLEKIIDALLGSR